MSKSSEGEIDRDWLTPDWPAPVNVLAYVSTRGAPLSAGPFGDFNTADHVGDSSAHVQTSRDRLINRFGFQYPPLWLDQVHGTHVVIADPDTRRQNADAVTTHFPGLPITIHTADCLPVFICNRSGTQVAIAHAGWRGLTAGVIENTVNTFANLPDELMVWLGPAIGPEQFEVGGEVRDTFINHLPAHASAFRPSPFTPDGSHWLCDIHQLARQRLAQMGIYNVFGGGFCTVTDPRFFSYRRDKITGRMLSVMWMEKR